MAFSMFSAQVSPIAIDFGSSSLKVLQVSADERPTLVAAVETPVPDSARTDAEKLLAFYTEHLPKALRSGKFKGKRAVSAVPSGQTFIQHMQVSPVEGVNRDDLLKAQLQAVAGVAPENVVVRAIDVGDVHRNAPGKHETICFAAGKDMVMRYIDLLRKCRLEVVGMHTETVAMVRAFDHLNRRTEDTEVATLYVDMGYAGTRVAISHGKDVVFARYVPQGGRHIDQYIANALHCDLATARNHRLTLGSDMAIADDGQAGTGTAILNVAMSQASAGSARGKRGRDKGATATAERRVGQVPAELRHGVDGNAPVTLSDKVDLTETLETFTDEISMCLRYHHSLFRGKAINRVIFVGGESRQPWLCQHIVRGLRLTAQLGDPLARLVTQTDVETPGLTLGRPQPGWAVACGLCATPTDM